MGSQPSPITFIASNNSCYWSTRRRRFLLSGVDGEGNGPEAVVVGAVGVAEGDPACFGELVFFCVEFVEGLAVEWDAEGGLSHPLFEELGHLLFGGLGEVDAGGVGDTGFLHVVDYVVAVLRVVDVD